MGKAKCFGTASAVAVVMSLFASGAYAEAVADADAPISKATSVDEVVVTGTFIQGTPKGGPLSVETIGRQDLERQGTPSVIDIVKNVMSATSSLNEADRFQTSSPVATVNLRGLGSARTLVLVNGQRMSASAQLAQTTDINLIPPEAIGRVEVLREGAAANYGSDAVAGVVNFITRRDLNGFEVNGDYTFIRGSNGDYQASISYGKQFDNGNLLLVGSYHRRSELSFRDRDWTNQSFAQNPLEFYSSSNNPGVFLTGTAAQFASGTFNQAFGDNGCAALGGIPVSATNPASGCRLADSRQENLIDDDYFYHLYGELNTKLTDHLKFHGEMMWAAVDHPNGRITASQSTEQYPTPILASGGSPGGGTSPYPANGQNQQSGYFIPVNNPGLVAWLANPLNCPALGAVCANAAANGAITSPSLWRPFGVNGNPSFPDYGGDARTSAFTKAFRIVGRLEGDFSGINWQATLNYGRNTAKSTSGGDSLVDRLQLALLGFGGPNCNPATGTRGVGSCMYFNPFGSTSSPINPITGAANPFFQQNLANPKVLTDWLQANIPTYSETELFTAETIFNGNLPLKLWSDQIGWALGGQFRYDRVEQDVSGLNNLDATPCVDSAPVSDGTPVCVNGTGPFVSRSDTRNYNISRSVSALFGEMRVPVTDKLELTGALRYEYYGGNFGSTTNPKLSARWQALDWLAFRAGAGTTFRAPPALSLTTLTTRTTTGYNLPGVGQLFRYNDVVGDPNLRPETAKTYNVGAIIQTSMFQATIDYYKINFKDQLTSEQAPALVTALFPSADPSTWQCNNAALVARMTFVNGICSPINFQGARTFLINGPAAELQGIDVQADVTLPWRPLDGRLTAGVDGNYLIKYQVGAVVTREGIVITPALDQAGKMLSFDSFPKYRANIYLNWNNGPNNLRWTTHYTKGPTNIAIASLPSKVDDEIVSDLVYLRDLPWDTKLTFAINNVFDSDPPLVRGLYGYDPTSAYLIGRNITIGLKKHF